MGRTGVVAALLDDAARTVRQVDTMTKAPAKRHNCEIRVANKNKHGNFTRTQDACGQRKANTRHSPHARAWTCAQHMSERGDNFHDDRMTHQPEDESAAPGGRAACGQALYGTWLFYVYVDEIPSDSAGASSQTAEELRTLRLSRKQTRAPYSRTEWAVVQVALEGRGIGHMQSPDLDPVRRCKRAAKWRSSQMATWKIACVAILFAA